MYPKFCGKSSGLADEGESGFRPAGLVFGGLAEPDNREDEGGDYEYAG